MIALRARCADPRRSGRAALAAGLGLLVLALGGCSRPSPLAPVVVSDARLEGRTVSWTTSEPTLGAVRWGRRAGRYDHVAYPAAPRSDRAPATAHEVTLLAAAAGDSVYLQVLARATRGTLTAGPAQAFRVASAPALGPLMTWTMVDVGFGDAHVLTMPTTGARVMVDGGERRDDVNVERWLDDAGIAGLQVVVTSHIHEDHIGALVGGAAVADDGVLARYPVGGLLAGRNPSAQRSAWNEVVVLCGSRGIPRYDVSPGDADATNPALAWDPAVRVEVLNAGSGRSIGGEAESDWINNDSVVMRVTYGTVSFLLAGDAEGPVETRLLERGATLEASVIKVAHHGSATSTGDAWLNAVQPRVGLIPIVSYESYGGSLPNGGVLGRLAAHGVDVFASDRAGALDVRDQGDAGENVTVATDGRSYEVTVTPSASRHWPPVEGAGQGAAR